MLSAPSFRVSKSSKRGFSSESTKSKIGVIPADGIGKEVVSATLKVLDSQNKLLSHLSYESLEAGWETFEKRGVALPKETVSTLKDSCVGALFGAVSSPIHKVAGYSSPIIGMRKELDLYANLRPIRSAPKNIPGSRPNVDMLIVRENTECLYVKKETATNEGEKVVKAVAERLITRNASIRIAEMAYKQADRRAKSREQLNDKTKDVPRVTIVHKSNVLSVTDGLFRECCLEVAKKYPHIHTEEQLVDSMVYKMILSPERYDVIVAPNLYGDILSDAGAALVGGLGLAPSANVGDKFILSEPVHGSAPDIAGKGIANPIATIRAAAMLLEHLASSPNNIKVANALEQAVYRTLETGPLTPDLGGKATTQEVTDAVIKNLRSILG